MEDDQNDFITSIRVNRYVRAHDFQANSRKEDSEWTYRNQSALDLISEGLEPREKKNMLRKIKFSNGKYHT